MKRFIFISSPVGRDVLAGQRGFLREISATAQTAAAVHEHASEAAARVALGVTRWADPSLSPAQLLAQAKAAKLQAIHAATAAGFGAGASAEGAQYGAASGVVFGITEADQAQWVAALAALANAEKVLDTDIGALPGAQFLGPLLNRAGQPVDGVTVAQFRAVMLSLTQAVGALRATHAARLAELAAATTVEEVDVISVG